MKIACLGWGSLVWNPDTLKCVGLWQEGGPDLPIEFCRTSKNGRLTLVLREGAGLVPTQFVEVAYTDGQEARRALSVREDCHIDAVGLWPGSAPKYAVGAPAIAAWAQSRGLHAVVWTALSPKFGGIRGQAPEDAAAVLTYLRGLDAPTSALAREYVVRAPRSVRTAYRTAIEEALGWTPE